MTNAYTELEWAIEHEGLIIPDVLQMDVIQRHNIREIAMEAIETCKEKLLVENVGYIIREILPEMQMWYLAVEQLDILDEMANHPDEVREIDGEGLLKDYAIWVGTSVCELNPPTSGQLTPWQYLQAFAESAWMPDKETVEEFLRHFYPEALVETFLKELAFD